METTQFEGLLPRLSTVEVELNHIKRDLRAAIATANAHESLRETTKAPEAPQPVPPPAPSPQPVAAPLPPPPPARKPLTAGDLEVALGGRWLHVVGLFLVFIGTAFFLKVAFDHNWIEPAFRVAMGIAGGAAIIAYAQLLAAKGQRYFSEGITALGAGIEFLSLYASNALFHLASPTTALLGMVAVNAVIAALAWRHKSERLGILAAIGGFLAPLLAGTQSADQVTLAAYIGLLDAGLLVLAELVDSRIVAPIALAGTLVYSFGSFSQAHTIDDLQRAAIYASLYAIFALAGWIVSRVRGRLDTVRSIVGGIAMASVLAGLESSLMPEHRSILAGALIALAVLHLIAAVAFKSRYQSWLAAAALTFAIPAAFDKAGFVNVAFAIEAAALTIAGLRYRDEVLSIAGYGLFGLDLVRDYVLYVGHAQGHPFYNERFISCAVTFAVAFVMARAIELMSIADYATGAVRLLRTVAHALALLTLSAEAWDTVAYFHGTEQASNAALSIVWASFAALLIGSGFVKRDAFMRWEGLGLIVVTAAKVLIFDLSFLDLSYRVISAVLVGVALIGVSYAYQRRPQDLEAA